MNENKLLACKIKPYTIELDEGQIVKVTNEVWVGYWNKSGEFSAVCWDRIEDGRLVGGDSVTVTSEEFADKVCKVIDIFGDTESYNVRYLLSLSQTQIADYDKRIAELAKANEWHYPSKGELPENNKLCLIQMKTGTFEIAYRVTDLCWKYKNTTFSCSFQSEIYAWKEIVFSKEIKEK